MVPQKGTKAEEHQVVRYQMERIPPDDFQKSTVVLQGFGLDIRGIIPIDQNQNR